MNENTLVDAVVKAYIQNKGTKNIDMCVRLGVRPFVVERGEWFDAETLERIRAGANAKLTEMGY